MRYRAEIDGLRAVAVMPVLLFHAGFALFGGGFVGVDVFFVISGYLITTLIIDELDNGSFSLIRFYERRARRILPALFFVCLACIPLAWLWLTSSDMKSFAQSLVAVATFWSNVLFWYQSGYFDTSAELKPLLHTWSLAVEEQYYIFFPLFLMLASKLGRRHVVPVLAVVFALSLLVAQWGAYHRAAATFYLLPTRGWELLTGAFAAFYLQRRSVAATPKVKNAMSAAGLVLILGAVFVYDRGTPFPSLYALVPTVGTLLIILCATPGTIVHAVLSSKPLVGTGLVSYSLYLWHQPLFAFTRHALPEKPPALVMLGLIALSAVLAFLTWRYVETPFRLKSRIARRQVWIASAAGAFVLVALGLLGYLSNGFPRAYPSVVDTNAENTLVEPTMVIGDSHAKHLLSGLDALMSAKVVDRTSPGCIPFYNVDRYDRRFTPGDCAKFTNSALDEFLATSWLRNLVMSTMGPVYLDETTFRNTDPARLLGQGVELIDHPEITDRYEIFETGMRNTFEMVAGREDKYIVFVIDTPELGIESCFRSAKELRVFGLTLGDLVRSAEPHECRIPRAEFDMRTARYHQFVRGIVADYPHVKLFDPTDLFCDKAWCNGYLEGVGYVYRDVDHLSAVGSTYIAGGILQYLD